MKKLCIPPETDPHCELLPSRRIYLCVDGSHSVLPNPVSRGEKKLTKNVFVKALPTEAGCRAPFPLLTCLPAHSPPPPYEYLSQVAVFQPPFQLNHPSVEGI